MASIRLGDLLVKAKVISDSQLKAALAEQQKWGGKLGELLVRMNFLTEDMLVKALSKQMNVPAVNLEAVAGVPPHVRAKVPPERHEEVAQRHGAPPGSWATAGPVWMDLVKRDPAVAQAFAAAYAAAMRT